MISLTYASRATQPFANQDLRALLEKSRTNNERRRLTGMLLHKNGQFMQVLEGDEADVTEAYGIIAADPRHTEARTLLSETIDARQFGQWSMGFHEIDSAATALPGFDPFLSDRRDATAVADSASRARMLLDWFRSRQLLENTH